METLKEMGLGNLESQKIIWVHVFPARFSWNPPPEDLRTLIILESGDVYSNGCDSLVAVYSEDDSPLKDDTKLVYTKLEQFSGLRMRKIVVGLGFGAGLTEEGELYLWGVGPHNARYPNSCKILEFQEEVTCLSGHPDGHCAENRKLGCSNWSYCAKTSSLPSRSPFPSSKKKPKKTAASGTVPLFCCRCGRACIGFENVAVIRDACKPPGNCKQCAGTYRLNHCESCHLLLEVSCTVSSAPLAKALIPLKILSGVTDVDCGVSFMCVSQGHNQLSVLSWQKPSGSSSVPSIRASVVGPTGNRLPVSSFSCGVAHIAAVTDQGKLYIYDYAYGGDVGGGVETQQLVVLRLVSGNRSPAKKVHCGMETTVCLLADHSIWLVYEGVQRTITSNLVGDFTGYVNLVDWFFFEDSSHSVWNVRKNPKEEVKFFQGENKYSALFSALKLSQSTEAETGEKKEVLTVMNFHTSQVANRTTHVGQKAAGDSSPQEVRSADSEHDSSTVLGSTTQYQSNTEELEGPEKTDNRPSLFGKPLFSDLTLKLADGDFPAHCLMLFMASNYFRKLFSSYEAPPKELDMSSYNARAYKTLLQYFYNQKPDDIDLEDLLDLYSLAVSYNETSICKTISNQLISLVDVDTVLLIMVKAKWYNDKPLIDKCEEILHSPAFNEKMLLSIKLDPSKFIL